MTYSIQKKIISEIKKVGKDKYIKSELVKRGIKIIDIARELNVSSTAVVLTIQDRSKSKRIARKIEEILGVPRGTLFEYLKEG